MVDTSNIQLYMVKNTSKRLNISDEEYFSSKYGKYVSNSRLKYINGDQKGSPDQFFSELKSEFSPSLVLGSAVHELTLQKGEFTMGPKSGLPNGKLGAAALFAVEKYVKGNIGILDALRHGCKKACYYLNSIESHLNDVFNVAKSFYFIYKANNKPGMIWLSDDQRETCLKCVESIENNKSIQHTFNPSDVFDFVKSYNEDALFVDFIVVYDGQSVIIPVKLKVDN